MATTTSSIENFNQIVLDSYGHPALLINAVTDRMEELGDQTMINVDPNNSVAILTETMAS
jgi:hypothetical protein